jgi:meiotic recombination protein REC8, fungi type
MQLRHGAQNDEDGILIFGDDDEVQLLTRQPSLPALDAAGATPAREATAPSPPGNQDDNESLQAATAAQTRAPRIKPVQVDSATELQNRVLGEWTNDYLANMDAANRQKQQYRAAAQGRRNAAFWILGQGIGGVQADFGDDPHPHPLAVFSGQTLLDALAGAQSPSPSGSKRVRSGSRDDERRVRPRADDEQGDVARGDADGDGDVMMGFDDDGIVMQGDNDAMPMEEVGRRAGSALPEHASIMPWSSSRPGSAVPLPFGSAGFGMSSSVDGGPAGSLVRGGRGSRLASTSPLMGKGYPRLPSLGFGEESDPAGQQLQAELDMEGGTDDFEQFGPAAAVDTQTAQQSQWMRATLENEAMNFLGFVVTQISDRRLARLEAGEGWRRRSIVMDELLPPEKNSAIVGAQALLHVLSLTTKGWLVVGQQEPFGDIVLEVSETQLVDMAGHADEGNEGDGDEDEDDEPDEL